MISEIECFSTMLGNAMQNSLINLRNAIKLDHHFPENVFLGQWKEFFFFDPDWLFDAKFVEKVNALLECDGGVCACVCNLDEADAKGDPQRAAIFLDRDTSGESYMSRLRGPGAGSGWLYRMDRYGCTSDIGEWCIYCERNNEIAVIAVRGSSTSPPFQSVIQSFNALPIEKAVVTPPSYGFQPRALPEDWRNRFIAEYGKRRH